MTFQVPYEAEFECQKRHRFKAEASPLEEGATAMCPHCYAEWVAANVPNGLQVSRAVPAKQKIAEL